MMMSLILRVALTAAVADRTRAALDRASDACGQTTTMFDVFGVNTTREAAAAIVKAIDSAGVPRVIEQAYARATARLPGPPMTVCVYAVELSKGIPYLGGVGGTSMGRGRIHIYLHPTKERFAKLHASSVPELVNRSTSGLPRPSGSCGFGPNTDS
jgi:hypothetical protein